MGHYKSNPRDLAFVLFEVFGLGDRLGHGAFADMDSDTAREVLAEIDRLATGPLADAAVDGDRNPPTFDPATHEVRLPESFHRAFGALLDGEWWRLDLPIELGGIGAPPSLRWAAAELLLGANPALFFYFSGFSFANTLWRIGTESQRRVAQLMVERKWASTMVLTEADAGSDVGAGRTRAVRQPDGTWHIEGVKRFITSGEHDLTENIIHFVLARPEGHGPGTKGLSLFGVPKYRFDPETGELGERNGVYATNLEHKMGLRASATCELTFGEREPAVGWLVGERHDGIAQMFRIIEYARMLVGTKAIATLSTGYLGALEYAKNRVQGADLTQLTDKTAPRVPITRHPDVRRMLMLQKSYAEGMRALVFYTASVQDRVAEAAHRGETDEAAVALNDLLLPLVKGLGSERSSELLALSLQTLGGSGYLADYPMEQYIRDARIDTLYEGTTSIQGLDLFFRKIVRDRGRALGELDRSIAEFAGADGDDRLKEERLALARGLDDARAMVGSMVEAASASREDPDRIYLVGQNTTRLLLSLGDLVVGWLLLREAEVALTALDREPGPHQRDRYFYEGKVAAARFFAATVLPELAARRTVAVNTDNQLMAVPEEAF